MPAGGLELADVQVTILTHAMGPAEDAKAQSKPLLQLHDMMI